MSSELPEGKSPNSANAGPNWTQVDDFERALFEGQSPRIEHFFRSDGDESSSQLEELLHIEIEYRAKRGEVIELTEYCLRFPAVVENAELFERLKQTRDQFSDSANPDVPMERPFSQTPSPESFEETVTSVENNQQVHEFVVSRMLGSYRLESQLGHGGMGTVYKAVHIKLDKVVAVKVLTTRLTNDPESIRRFEREMKAVGRLSHPHIVQAFDAGEIDGVHYLAMEFVNGVNLHEYLKQNGPMPVHRACETIRQAALALSAAHQVGLFHRDVKPSNLLLDESSQIKLLDLGLARLVDETQATTELTTAGQMFGTPDYMAPEQWEDARKADARTDLYALGCTLFTLLIGRPPYGDDRHKGKVSKMTAHVTEAIPDLKRLRPDVPEVIVAIYENLMAKSPEARYQTAKELVEALRSWISLDEEARTNSQLIPLPEVVVNTRGLKSDQDRMTKVDALLQADSKTPDDPNLLHAVWDRLDPELQDAFSLAYSKKRRTGSTRISTRDLFEALARLGTGPVRQVFTELPAGAIPQPADAAIAIDQTVLKEQPLLSDCVHESLTVFQQFGADEQRIAPVDLFVDVAKHGHGPSVIKLREHGIDPEAVERIIRKLGLRVVRREELKKSAIAMPQDSVDKYLVSDENVQFSVYRPKTIRLGTWEPLLAFAHISELPADAPADTLDPIAEVRRQAEQILGSKSAAYQSLTIDSSQSIPRSSELTFVPTGKGLEFNPPQRTFQWREPIHREEFRVRADSSLEGKVARGWLSVYLGRLLIAEVSIVTKVDRQAAIESNKTVLVEEHSRRFRRIYACIARNDLALITEFQRYATLLGDDYFTSQLWPEKDSRSVQEQRQAIASADIFQLYWSRQALSAPEMEQEWRYAVSLRRPDFVRPLYWEEPFPTDSARFLPPAELLTLGFQKIPQTTCGDDVSMAKPHFQSSDLENDRPSLSTIGTSCPPDSNESVLDKILSESRKNDPVDRQRIGETFQRTSVNKNPGSVATIDVADLVGRVLDGRYLIEKLIDRGGYDLVFKGTDQRMEQPVAIKVIVSSREFNKEARLVAEIKHPNIVNVSDFGSDKGVAYLVTDFLHGESLEQLFERQGRKMLPAQLSQFVNEIGDALAIAHDHRLIHRDVKPRNIILKESISRSGTTTRHSQFVLFDFGIAAKIDSKDTLRNITKTGAGTLEYMAPELLEKEPQATAKSDIYSFGVILYQMMMGRVPFPQSDTSHVALLECLQAICTQNPPSFKDLAPDRVYPAEMEALVLQCLEKKPDRRPQSMAEVKERFIRIVDGILDDPIPDNSRLSDENVQFSVYRPKAIRPEKWEPLLAFAHISELPADAPADTPDPIAEVRRQAEQILGSKSKAYQPLTVDSSQSIPRSSELTFVPTGEGLEFNPTQRTFQWREPIHREEFRFRADPRLDGRIARGRMSVYLGRLLIAEVSIVTKVDGQAVVESSQPEYGEGHSRRFRRIYACIARNDLALITEFRRYAALLGDDYLTSQLWTEKNSKSVQEQQRAIASADIFQLYWSRQALGAPEMEQEWRYAVSLGRPEFVRPLYWEEPFPTDPKRSLPPAELLTLGFQKIPQISEVNVRGTIKCDGTPRDPIQNIFEGATASPPKSRDAPLGYGVTMCPREIRPAVRNTESNPIPPKFSFRRLPKTMIFSNLRKIIVFGGLFLALVSLAIILWWLFAALKFS